MVIGIWNNTNIIYNGILTLYNRLDEAQRELEDKFDFLEEDYIDIVEGYM